MESALKAREQRNDFNMFGFEKYDSIHQIDLKELVGLKKHKKSTDKKNDRG
jgi:hypothetical protein